MMKDLAFRVIPVVLALPPSSSELAGVILRLSTDNKPYWCDGTGWFDLTLMAGLDARITVARLSGDVTSNTTTLANITGLAIALAANATYAIDARVMFQSGATSNGIRLTQTAPALATVVAQWATPTSLTAKTFANQRTSDSGGATSGIDAANANSLACGELLVNTGATAGSLQIRFASEVTSSNVVIKAGSHLIAHKVS